MATDWAAEAMSVYEDFKEEEFAVTVRFPGVPGAWDEETMSRAEGTADTDYTTYAIKRDYTVYEIDGKVVQKGDIRLLIPVYGTDEAGDLVDIPTPNMKTKIVINDAELNIENFDPVDPANVPIMYVAQVRS